jgi:hypothetical protein
MILAEYIMPVLHGNLVLATLVRASQFPCIFDNVCKRITHLSVQPSNKRDWIVYIAQG